MMTKETTSSRVVEIVNESPTGTRVKIRNLYEPIATRLFDIARPRLIAYHNDLIHDALMLADSAEGDKFMWGYRESGTTMIRLKRTGGWTYGQIKEMVDVCLMTDPLESWHLIEITKMRRVYADGYVTWMNLKDKEHFILAWVENAQTA